MVEQNSVDTLNDEAALNFEPGLEELFFVIASGDYQRLIFSGGQKLREREEKHIADFRKYLET